MFPKRFHFITSRYLGKVGHLKSFLAFSCAISCSSFPRNISLGFWCPVSRATRVRATWLLLAFWTCCYLHASFPQNCSFSSPPAYILTMSFLSLSFTLKPLVIVFPTSFLSFWFMELHWNFHKGRGHIC